MFRRSKRTTILSEPDMVHTLTPSMLMVTLTNGPNWFDHVTDWFILYCRLGFNLTGDGESQCTNVHPFSPDD